LIAITNKPDAIVSDTLTFLFNPTPNGGKDVMSDASRAS